MTNVKLSKEGPIHDVRWSPKGDEFVAVFGYSPSKAVIFNTKCEEATTSGSAGNKCVARRTRTAHHRRRGRRRCPQHRSLSVSPPPHPTSAQVRWSPHARFLIIAGFGNLSGELSFWDRKTCKCLGTVRRLATPTTDGGGTDDSPLYHTSLTSRSFLCRWTRT